MAGTSQAQPQCDMALWVATGSPQGSEWGCMGYRAGTLKAEEVTAKMEKPVSTRTAHAAERVAWGRAAWSGAAWSRAAVALTQPCICIHSQPLPLSPDRSCHHTTKGTVGGTGCVGALMSSTPQESSQLPHTPSHRPDRMQTLGRSGEHGGELWVWGDPSQLPLLPPKGGAPLRPPEGAVCSQAHH